MKPSEVLREAAKLIQEKGWTQRVYARDDLGRRVHPNDPDACQFCAAGAIGRVTTDDSSRVWDHPATKALESSLSISIPKWNDSPLQHRGEVIAKMLEVADRLEAHGE